MMKNNTKSLNKFMMKKSQFKFLWNIHKDTLLSLQNSKEGKCIISDIYHDNMWSLSLNHKKIKKMMKEK